MLTYILFLLGFPLLIKGADMLVSGASTIALKYGIPSLVVGLTVVAFGTSAPELAVNIFSALKGSTELVIGNVIGSNISNILLILGITACIIALPAEKSTVYKEIPFSLIAVALLLGAGIFLGGITFFVSLVLLALFIGFLLYTLKLAKAGKIDIATNDAPVQKNMYHAIFLLIAGLVGLVLGGKWIVDGAVLIAVNLGMSELVIGLTIVAIGTSLPELATSVIAALKGETGIAIGNIIGSNIFNVLLVLGVSGLITPIAIQGDMYRDIGVNIGATVLLFLFLVVGKKYILSRLQGAILLIFFLIYISFLVFIS